MISAAREPHVRHVSHARKADTSIERFVPVSQRSDHAMVSAIVSMHPECIENSRAFFCHRLLSNVMEKALCRNISI